MLASLFAILLTCSLGVCMSLRGFTTEKSMIAKFCCPWEQQFGD